MKGAVISNNKIVYPFTSPSCITRPFGRHHLIPTFLSALNALCVHSKTNFRLICGQDGIFNLNFLNDISFVQFSSHPQFSSDHFNSNNQPVSHDQIHIVQRAYDKPGTVEKLLNLLSSFLDDYL